MQEEEKEMGERRGEREMETEVEKKKKRAQGNTLVSSITQVKTIV